MLFRSLMQRSLWVLGAVLSCSPAAAQAVEGVLVETYAVTPGLVPGDVPLTTYRIYVDLAPGYQLQMVYGDVHHLLRINTTTDFYNAPTSDTRYAYQVSADHLSTFPVALDSWLTIGAASDRHMGVPKQLDRDGSILECPPYGSKLPGSDGPVNTTLKVEPLCLADGLVPDTAIREIVDFKFSTSYLGKLKGAELSSNNGAWAALGGAMGSTPENLVLIAQLSTTGEISFELNLQLGDPDHMPVKYVARDAGPGEVLCPALVRAPSAR